MNRALVYELATARFIAQREDGLFLGPPCTGKSHLAQAIGRAAILQGYRVVYREAHTLLENLPRRPSPVPGRPTSRNSRWCLS
jgi:DNA replication protein DnaC